VDFATVDIWYNIPSICLKGQAHLPFCWKPTLMSTVPEAEAAPVRVCPEGRSVGPRSTKARTAPHSIHQPTDPQKRECFCFVMPECGSR
jgi:hypothetical protein